MRIIRTIIVLTGLGFVMPAPPEEMGSAAAATSDISAPGVLGSAAMAVADVVGFCQRQPGVCQTAGSVAGRFEAKAKYSVRLLYEWANDTGVSEGPASAVTVPADPMTTSSTTTVIWKTGATNQSTLKIEDLIPDWRGPVAPKNS